MKQISRTTNPTGLHNVDRRHFLVRVSDDAGGRVFWLERFDHKAAGINAEARIGCVASAGSTEQYFRLGTAGGPERRPRSIDELARDKPLRFRFSFHMPGETRLVGFADGVRPADETGQLGGSLVDIEPCELGGLVWTIQMPTAMDGPGEKPCVQVERTIFPTAQAAVSHPWFVALVMPEVMRRVALLVAEEDGCLENDGTWLSDWAGFFTAMDVGPSPPEQEEWPDWAEQVARRFAGSGAMKHQVDRIVAEMNGEDA